MLLERSGVTHTTHLFCFVLLYLISKNLDLNLLSLIFKGEVILQPTTDGCEGVSDMC